MNSKNLSNAENQLFLSNAKTFPKRLDNVKSEVAKSNDKALLSSKCRACFKKLNECTDDFSKVVTNTLMNVYMNRVSQLSI